MKREDIKGFTIKVLGYAIECVIVKHILREIAVYKNNNRDLVKRLEW